MSADQLALDLGDGITVYVVAPDGVRIDVIDNVDLGDPIEAHRNGRTSLKEACLWGYLATKQYEQEHGHRRSDSTPPPRSSPTPPAGAKATSSVMRR